MPNPNDIIDDTCNLSRRKVLQTTGISLAAATGLAGCSGGSDDGGEATPMDIEEWPPTDYSNQLNLWNWYDDWAEWAMDAFPEEYDGVSVSNSGYSSAEQWYSQLEAGNEEIDNIAATTNWVDRSIENDYLHELPVDSMPNWEHVLDRVKEVSSYRQDGSIYAVPESLVLYPLTYNTDEFGEDGPDSWGVLWDEEYEGRITMWDHSTVSCQIAAMYTGQDPIEPDDYEEIREVLTNQKPLVRTYWGDYQQGMSLFVNEDVVAGPLTMGRTYSARFQEDAPVHYTAPEEGALFTSDLFVVPKGAPNPITATLFTNWATDPANAYQLFDTMGYKPSVDISDSLSDRDAEFTKWPDSWNLQFQETLTDDVRGRYDEIWTEVKAA
ncbi:ABC transporter substrate-binding protein [Halodesulfurarchaeum sp.]|uniref:ABC transporter substrate-binding protein n=1 Tax=Halodesulfurarchaeum sp. TaxID=1980530 RepID=UPI002FC2BCE4